MDNIISAHPVWARIIRHAIRFVLVAALTGVTELLASAIVHGQPIPDTRTLVAAAMGPALLGVGRVLAEVDNALASADVSPPSNVVTPPPTASAPVVVAPVVQPTESTPAPIVARMVEASVRDALKDVPETRYG